MTDTLKCDIGGVAAQVLAMSPEELNAAFVEDALKSRGVLV